ncbi:HTH domain-containing protein [Campylobacter jejuni]|nr:HTH domain-containing protein [Campylobacter jejuni]
MKEYDKLSIRLVQILSKFNNGESLSAQELAQEFNVDTRTIQRDLNERLAFMPIKKKMEDMF